jgi:beta-lactamase regulating signal transducer with metallopeptidase domain
MQVHTPTVAHTQYRDSISVFDICFRILLWFLPFVTILSIFFREKIGISGVGFLKE